MTTIDWNPSSTKLRRFGFIACAVFGSFAVLGRSTSAVTAALVALAATSALFSVVLPAANRPLYVTLLAVGWPVRWATSHALLAIVFFGVVTPVGILRRLFAGDPLQRRWDKNAKTYWRPVRPKRAPDDYFRVF